MRISAPLAAILTLLTATATGTPLPPALATNHTVLQNQTMQPNRTLSRLADTTLSKGPSHTGINCDGSLWCWNEGKMSEGIPPMSALVEILHAIPDDSWWENGAQIACVLRQRLQKGGLCAFMQKSDGALGSEVKMMAKMLILFGCDHCGSVPYDMLKNPWGASVMDGMLTINFVWHTCRIVDQGPWKHAGGICPNFANDQ